MPEKVVKVKDYDPHLLDVLKVKSVTYTQEEDGLVIRGSQPSVDKLMNEYFYEVVPKLVLFKCTKTPKVNKMSLLEIKDNEAFPTRGWCYTVLEYRGKVEDGEFKGLVLAIVRMGKHTKIECDDYVSYNYSRSIENLLRDSISRGLPYEEIVKNMESFGENEVVAVSGFLVISRLPSQSLLNAVLPKEYKDEKIGKELIRIVRGYFYNKLQTLSRKFYKILEKHAVDVGFGYVVPYSNVQAFLRKVEELKREYRTFERDLKDFLETGKKPEVKDGAVIDFEYVELVKEYLKKHGVDELKVPNISERVVIKLLPFSVDIQHIIDYLDPKVVEEVKGELEEVRRTISDSIRKEIETKAEEIRNKLQQYAETKFKKALLRDLKADLEHTISMARDLGVVPVQLEGLLSTVKDLESCNDLPPVERSARIEALLKGIRGSSKKKKREKA